MILEGHLDDTYYQYTSLFHSGRLSRNDNKYLIQIRGFINPDPGFQIDNPKEVITAMREEDFGQLYVLNVALVDCLLGEAAEYHYKIDQMLAFLVANFDACDAFFTSYFATGKEVPGLLDGVLKAWPDYISTVISDTRYLQHVAQIVARLPIRSLETLSARSPEIADFASSNLAEILALGIETDPVRLKALGIEATDLPSVDGFPGIARFLVQEELYTLTVANLEFIFQSVLGVGDLEPMRTRCHTTVMAADNPALLSRIERDFGSYLGGILLQLPSNSGESVDAVLDIIGRDDLELKDRRLFLDRQSAILPSLDGVPQPFHAFIFEAGKVEPTWRNCLDFMESSAFNAESLTTYLDRPSSYAALTEQPIPEGESASTLRRFLINSDSLTNDHYRGYVRSLPTVFIKFPVEIGEEKLRIVIEEGKVEFSKDNLDYLTAHGALKSLFSVLNIDALLSEQTALGLDDEFRETLLGKDIGDPRKLAIIDAMDLEALPSAPKRAGTVGNILERNGADLSTMSVPSIRAIILNASPIPVQISLFNRARDRLQDEDVRDILSNLPEPYSDIRTGYRTPRLKNTEVNVQLAKWLDERKIISSWNETLFGDEIKINLYRS